MFILTTAITYLTVINFCESSPIPSGGNHLKLDQRQEGEWNVRADIENVLVLIVPSNLNTGMASLALLDLFRKAPTNKKVVKNVRKNQQINTSTEEQTANEENRSNLNEEIAQQIDGASHQIDRSQQIETQHFIESKTAPYHVDLTKTRTNLVKLHPNVENDDDRDLLIAAHSPAISIFKNSDNNNLERNSRAYVISIPVNKGKLINSKNYKNNKEKELTETENWRLLGDGIENCGPGLVRDSKGICKTVSQ